MKLYGMPFANSTGKGSREAHSSVFRKVISPLDQKMLTSAQKQYILDMLDEELVIA